MFELPIIIKVHNLEIPIFNPTVIGEKAQRITKTYSLFLENYLNIYVSFETRRIKLKEKYVNYSKNEIIGFIKTFFTSFDKKDWELMKKCLADKLELDYESFRGEPKYSSSSRKYIEKRKIGLKELKTEHETNGHIFRTEGQKIKCECNYIIKRFEIGSNEYYHSYGKYEIWLVEKEMEFEIIKIKQVVVKNEGNKYIHGAFKNEN